MKLRWKNRFSVVVSHNRRRTTNISYTSNHFNLARSTTAIHLFVNPFWNIYDPLSVFIVLFHEIIPAFQQFRGGEKVRCILKNTIQHKNSDLKCIVWKFYWFQFFFFSFHCTMCWVTFTVHHIYYIHKQRKHTKFITIKPNPSSLITLDLSWIFGFASSNIAIMVFKRCLYPTLSIFRSEYWSMDKLTANNFWNLFGTVIWFYFQMT